MSDPRRFTANEPEPRDLLLGEFSVYIQVSSGDLVPVQMGLAARSC